jgi:uncharacterized protein YndB with AHSA1/START domain
MPHSKFFHMNKSHNHKIVNNLITLIICIEGTFFIYCTKSKTHKIGHTNNANTLIVQMKKKIILEYTLNSSPKVLYPRLSTPGGLAEWFADNVNIHGGQFSFFWEQTEQKAEIIQKKDNRYIRFRWVVSEKSDTNWFEFRINTDELTGDTALIITDFTDEEDKDSTIELWNSQIAKLKHVIGL